MKKRFAVFLTSVLLLFTLISVYAQKYEPNWTSLKQMGTPKWLQNGKFGIYTHWGPYAVHAYGSNTTWYSNALYLDEDGEARTHFEENFGKLTPEYGYKDLIPEMGHFIDNRFAGDVRHTADDRPGRFSTGMGVNT